MYTMETTTTKNETTFTANNDNGNENTNDSTLDPDTLRLAEMGYTQDMTRHFSILSLLGVSFALVSSWFGISASLITGINSGGTVLTIYGIPWMAFISLCVGVSLSELASAMPNSGGQYFWAGQLAARKYARVAAYLTGWLSWAGAVFGGASITLSLATAIMGMWQLGHPEFHIKSWHTVVAYEVLNSFSFIFNCFGKLLPKVAMVTLYVSLVSFMVILITVPAAAHTHATAQFVFAKFVNSTGWPSDGIAFLVGLINPNLIFAGLDSATHLAEEVPRPERSIPIAILGTVVIGFVTSWTYCIALFFSANDLDDILRTPTSVPILALYYQALGNRAGAIVLGCLILATGVGCQIACHTWQSRLCWSFARDRGLPAASFLDQVHPALNVPLNAHITSCSLVGLLGLLYLGSSTAFNSMITASIILLYSSYVVPVVCLLIRGRERIRHGPFWLGRVGYACNLVLLLWTGFCLVIYSFPPVYPVTPGNMNYVSAVYGVLMVVIGSDWVIRGRHCFRGQAERRGCS